GVSTVESPFAASTSPLGGVFDVPPQPTRAQSAQLVFLIDANGRKLEAQLSTRSQVRHADVTGRVGSTPRGVTRGVRAITPFAIDNAVDVRSANASAPTTSRAAG